LFGTRSLPASAENALYSLAFLTQVLTYWYAKANRISSPGHAEIDDLLKRRNVTASALLAMAGELLLLVTEKSTDLRDPAWRKRAMQRRAVAYELFLLC